MANPDQMPGRRQTARPTAAGLYDVYLGGTQGTEAERAVADQIRAAMPELEATVWANRAFHQRSIRWLVQQGIRQFIDLGSGLPTQDNTHQVAGRLAPDSKVVYVDWDEDAVALGRHLVADDPNAEFVQADIRRPDEVLAAPAMTRLIDLTRPVGVLATAIMHFISDYDDPWGLVAKYRDAVAPGSYFAMTHITADKQSAGPVRTIGEIYAKSGSAVYFRNRDQVEWLFQGMEVVPPYEGAAPRVTFMGYWFCEDPKLADDDSNRWAYAGVARVP